MAKFDVYSLDKKKVGEIDLKDEVFAGPVNDHLFWEVVKAKLASDRSGTHAVKNRSLVSGGGKKPWKQKGTGRARAGSTRGTQWRHGGIAHGPKPHGYATRMNKNERRRALCLALSSHVRDGRITVLDKLELKNIKTSDFVQVMQKLDISNGLVVLGDESREVMLSGRNVKHAKVVLDGQMNLHDLLKFDHLVLTKAAIEKLEGRLS